MRALLLLAILTACTTPTASENIGAYYWDSERGWGRPLEHPEACVLEAIENDSGIELRCVDG